MKSAFDTWFVAQHGARPSGLPDVDLEKQIANGVAAEKLLARRHAWDARMESALYAWQLTDNKKKMNF